MDTVSVIYIGTMNSHFMNFVGMHNLSDDLEKGLMYQINNLQNKSNERTTLSLLQVMLPYFTYHR
jgi:hypothetical protein